MVLGLAKNKWHVPTQVLASTLFVIGYFLAHAHNGRNYVIKNTTDKIKKLFWKRAHQYLYRNHI